MAMTLAARVDTSRSSGPNTGNTLTVLHSLVSTGLIPPRKREDRLGMTALVMDSDADALIINLPFCARQTLLDTPDVRSWGSLMLLCADFSLSTQEQHRPSGVVGSSVGGLVVRLLFSSPVVTQQSVETTGDVCVAGHVIGGNNTQLRNQLIAGPPALLHEAV
ncbi:hypothetical protein BKA67DRAFT_541861 [Truncatella angustata]|uniref:Uncharacterized protein n=1 Tax=Truncatella angustata TaxID=152316 RepID=A0A9P8UB87_9PEZI|nr:uncharacterized protein BKA67DRAFT_541861 [Truncatella angustata]KAH6645692.1 hypothetical protein BKA67DRAFT_541861 [Truncatella angustata]